MAAAQSAVKGNMKAFNLSNMRGSHARSHEASAFHCRLSLLFFLAGEMISDGNYPFVTTPVRDSFFKEGRFK